MAPSTSSSPPIGWKWRSSVWFVTLVVAFGQAVDMLVYGLTIPVVPFRLQELGYDKVSSKSGWLLFAFSLGMIVSTPPISWLSERYHARRWPLLLGLAILIGSQALFMEAKDYWMMLLARVIQGISSTIVWVVALALLCDTVPKENMGRQLGVTMMGYSLGIIAATPLGGLLYGRMGYRAPFIFGMICAAVDLLGRILVIEKADADRWRVAEISYATEIVKNDEKQPTSKEAGPETCTDRDGGEAAPLPAAEPPSAEPLAEEVTLTEMQVISKLVVSFRPAIVLVLALIWGVFFTAIEPTLPLRAQDIWHLDPTKVGIVFLAASVPSLLSGPLAGILSDKTSPGLVAAVCVALSIPWMYPFVLKGKLAVFVLSLVFSTFFASGVMTPITAELAAVTRDIPGMGYAHSYGAFNMAYATGSILGPVLGGQIYDSGSNGWMILCAVLAGVLAVALVCALFMGETRIASRAYWHKGVRQNAEHAA
ncbi:MFS general substrate transporter [Auricularia subglabra TFB-10046 SS5]|nr:MFS general substrate transporter [Auricularia subglabra TFB-10046 SS5]